MRVLIVELAFFLLIVTAFNVRREHDQPDDDYDLSHEALKTLMARLEKDVKQQISDDDGEVERVEKTATTTTAVTEEISHPEHVSGDITLRLYPTGMKYALEVRNNLHVSFQKVTLNPYPTPIICMCLIL